MKTKPTLLDLLRKQSEMYLRDLPEIIRIPALDGSRTDEVVRPLPISKGMMFNLRSLQAGISKPQRSTRES